jgi:hypothetical protein
VARAPLVAVVPVRRVAVAAAARALVTAAALQAAARVPTVVTRAAAPAQVLPTVVARAAGPALPVAAGREVAAADWAREGVQVVVSVMALVPGAARAG